MSGAPLLHLLFGEALYEGCCVACCMAVRIVLKAKGLPCYA